MTVRMRGFLHLLVGVTLLPFVVLCDITDAIVTDVRAFGCAVREWIQGR